MQGEAPEALVQHRKGEVVVSTDRSGQSLLNRIKKESCRKKQVLGSDK